MTGRSASSFMVLVVFVGSVTMHGAAFSAESSSVTEEEITIEDSDTATDDGELVIEDDEGPSDQDDLVIEDADTSSEKDAGELVIDSGGDEPVTDDIQIEGDIAIEPSEEGFESEFAADSAMDSSQLDFSLDDVWLEGGYVGDSAAPADALGYGKIAASVNWQPNPQWELQLAGRADVYDQSGSRSFTDFKGDYGDSYVRFRGDNVRLTAGSQTLIWGRIDELPPSDRVSTVDLRRFILDDLPDRRLSTPMVRVEAFLESAKLDLVWLYAFREAELPDRDSIWYPVDKEKGQILGVKPPAALAAAFRTSVQNGLFDDSAPNGDGGFAARYTRTQANIDFGVTAGKTRSSVPYFRFDGGNFKAEYPRSWVYGADAAFEGAGATWRFEALYNSDTPVTRTDLTYTTEPAWSWGGGVEFHPGDGDTRVNLQLVGFNLVDPPSVIDRTEIYNFNGAISAPFAHNRWQADLRFFFGLDENDVYINPKISFVGWEPHELYLAVHYFDGDDGTLGGFHQDHSAVNLGWRAQF